MEIDYICFYCWSQLPRDDQVRWENQFVNKHGFKFGVQLGGHKKEKYLQMLDEIMAGPGR
jgi:hypothetical protein